MINKKSKIEYYLPIVLGWFWKKIIINAYRFRILETLLYLIFIIIPTDFDGTPLEIYARLFFIGFIMICINMHYQLYDYEEYDNGNTWGIKILFNNDTMRLAGFFVGGLLILPTVLSLGLGAFIVVGVFSMLWKIIKYFKEQ